MYYYGKPEPCDRLNRAGAQTRAIAGHGVYIAGNPSSSLTYFEGGITQVILAHGTPILDLTDPATSRRMYELGIDVTDIYNLPI